MAAPFIHMEMTSRGVKELADPALASRARFAMVEAALPVVFAQAKTEAPGSGRTKAKALVQFMDQSTATGHVRALFPLSLMAKGTKPHAIGVQQGAGRGRKRRSVPFQEWFTAAGTVVTTRQRGNFRALRFSSGGGLFFRRRVMHPGTRPNPFMHEAAANSATRAAQAADDALQVVLDRAGR